MRRTCATCEEEYNDDEKGAFARVDGKFFLACGGPCLVTLIKSAEGVEVLTALQQRFGE